MSQVCSRHGLPLTAKPQFMRLQAGRGNLVSEGRLAECLELLAEEQERGRRLLALMHAHDQAAADRTDSLMLKARHCSLAP